MMHKGNGKYRPIQNRQKVTLILFESHYSCIYTGIASYPRLYGESLQLNAFACLIHQFLVNSLTHVASEVMYTHLAQI